MRFATTATLLLALAAGPAATAAPDTPAKPAAGKDAPADRQCFYSGQVNGYRAQSDKIVNVRVGVRDVYQFELMTRCPDIRWNNALALVSRGSSFICSGLDAELVTHTPIGPQRCPVSNIRKLTPAEVAALPKGARP